MHLVCNQQITNLDVIASLCNVSEHTVSSLVREIGEDGSYEDITNRALQTGVQELVAVQLVINRLFSMGYLSCFSSQNSPLAKLTALSFDSSYILSQIDLTAQYKISRFALIRRLDDLLIAESPLGKCRVQLLMPITLAILAEFTNPVAISEVCKIYNMEPKEMNDFAALLLSANIIGPILSQGSAVEDTSVSLQQWEFHDLLFHTRSRVGRSDAQGATFRFRNSEVPSTPFLQKKSYSVAIDLPRAGEIELPSLNRVLSERASVRNQGQSPITVEQLGRFLDLSASISYIYDTEMGSFTRRPYPSGGASYELEIYLNVAQCAGLPSGLYYYEPLTHSLQMICGSNRDTEMLLMEAWLSSAKTCKPQILILMASRFQRVAWKYEGMAYATQLKNVGALMSVFYLTATALGLAPCGVGLGNIERFARLTGVDFTVEGSVGEFMLGSVG